MNAGIVQADEEQKQHVTYTSFSSAVRCYSLVRIYQDKAHKCSMEHRKTRRRKNIMPHKCKNVLLTCSLETHV